MTGRKVLILVAKFPRNIFSLDSTPTSVWNYHSVLHCCGLLETMTVKTKMDAHGGMVGSGEVFTKRAVYFQYLIILGYLTDQKWNYWEPNCQECTEATAYF